MADHADGASCPNCSEPHGPADVFCENCGYDFLSGALPPPLDPPPAPPGDAAVSAGDASPNIGAAAPTPPADAEPTTATATIGVDHDYFALMAPDGGVDAPPDGFTTVEVPLKGSEVLLGRTSMSRGVFPDLDILEITSDPAVSTRHATLLRSNDGSWTITDLNSTNGTHVGTTDTAIAPGEAVALAPGTTVFLGAYTTLTLRTEPPGEETDQASGTSATDLAESD